MAATKIADIIVPSVFAPYVIEEIPKHSALISAGIVVPDAALDILAQRGGKLINMPFFNDLTGDDEGLSDTTSLTPGKITTGQDVAALLMRGKAWGVNDLAKALSGADPMEAIGSLVAGYWVKREQVALISTLKGVMADNVANDSGDLVHDASIADGDNAGAENKMGAAAVIDAAGKLGDQLGVLTAICMHSVPYTNLLKLQLIDMVDASTEEKAATGQDQVPTFLGKRVIVDDTCPVVAGVTSGYVYSSYLFAQGAVGRGEGSAPTPVETDRDSLAGEDYLIHRRHFLLHVRGIAFQNASVAGEQPENSELETAANWSRVYPQKTIRVIELKTNG
jgi:hypothetical protein